MPTSYSLINNRLRGTIVLNVTSSYDYGTMRFNGQGTIGSSAEVNEQTFNQYWTFTTPQTNGGPTINVTYQDRSVVFAHLENSQSTQISISFDIELMRDAQNAREPIMMCRGRWSYGSKTVGNPPSYRAYGFFERSSNQTSISQISIGNWNTGVGVSAITFGSLDLNIIPIPTFTAI
jgi:hypothetical protein